MNGMTMEHAQALNRVLAVGGLRAELDKLIRCRQQFFEVERLGLLAETARGFLLSFYVDGYTMKECYISLHIAERTVWRYRAMVEND